MECKLYKPAPLWLPACQIPHARHDSAHCARTGDPRPEQIRVA